MKKPAGFLRVLGVAGLLIGLLAATVAPVAAQEDGEVVDVEVGRSLAPLFSIDDPGFLGGTNTIFYPWVANDDDFGLGPADTSISVQNLEDVATQIFIYVGNGNGGYDLATSAFLAPWAAKTFHAAQLGLDEGEGAPVAVASFTTFGLEGVPDADFPGTGVGDWLIETPVILSNPVADEDAGGEFTQVVACVVNIHAGGNLDFGSPYPFRAAVDFSFDGVDYDEGDWVDWDTQADLQAILDAVNEADEDGQLINPFGGLNIDGDCFDAIGPLGTPVGLDSVAIGGVAKQAVDGEALPSTSEADTSVSGYNAINGYEVAYFDEWYLPIVQTNCGPGGCWDSMIRVGTMFGQNAAVEIRFFPADDGSGSLATGFQIQGLVQGGDTWHVNLGDYVPEGWVGSAHIYSDGNVFAMVDRYKVGYNMWITNTGSSAGFENAAQFEDAQGRYVLFAPHVLLDYFGWNTGINVANLAGVDNNISVQYFNMLGNATEVLTQRLAAHGMTYFYDPSVPPQNIGQDPTFGEPVMNDPNANVVGSALIWSDEPVAVAVDATKYPETDPTGAPDVFQATSYSATQNVYNWQAVPLVQKGSPTTGMGDTSGINIMNPNDSAVQARVYYTNPSGFNASNYGVSSVTIPAYANGFLYTMTQHNLPNGFVGSAVVVATQPVVAASANVNYEVQFDGAAIFNAFNPCGFYRTTGIDGDCFFGNPFDVTGRSVTKTFVDQFGDPVPGVTFQINGTSEFFNYQEDGISGLTDGSATFTNVPVGEYELNVTSVPDGYTLEGSDVYDEFTMTQGEDVVLTNVIQIETEGFTKTVVVAGTLGDDDDIVEGTEFIAGVDVIVYNWVGTGTDGFVTGATQLTAQTDASGVVGGNLAAGTYVLCLYDADGTATVDGTTVFPVLPAAPDRTFVNCEDFTIDDDGTVNLVNEVDLFAQGVSKTVVVAGTLGEDDEVTEETVLLSGVNVAVFASVDGVISGDALDADLSVSGGFAASLDPGTYFLCVYDADGLATILVDGVPVTVVVDLDTDILGAVCEPFTVVLGATTILVNEVTVLTFGDLLVITTSDGVDAPGIDVAVYALAEGEDCLDINPAIDAFVVSSTTGFGAEFLFEGLAPGTYCVVADFDDDGFDANDVFGEVVVEADGTSTIILDEFGDVTNTFLTAITSVGDVLGAYDVEVYAGLCADVDVTADTAIATGTTDATTGEVDLSGFAAGDVCVVADLDGGGFDNDDVSVDVTVLAGITAFAILNLENGV